MPAVCSTDARTRAPCTHRVRAAPAASLTERVPVRYAVLPLARAKAVLWCVQAPLSFMADYVALGQQSRWHTADRLCATSLFLVNMTYGIRAVRYTPGPIIGQFGVIALTATAALYNGTVRAQSSPRRMHGWAGLSCTAALGQQC